MGEGARIAEASGAAVIDINMGCPAKHVTNGQSGSALMRDLDHALTLIEATIAAVSVPVTLKMRLGWDHQSINAPELARRAEAGGHASDHRAWPHALPILQGRGRLGGGARGEGRRFHSRRRQRRYRNFRRRRCRIACLRRRRGHDRTCRAGPSVVSGPDGALSRNRQARASAAARPSARAHHRALSRDAFASWACASGFAMRASISAGRWMPPRRPPAFPPIF